MSTRRLGPPLRSVVHSISPATAAGPRAWRAVPSRSLDLRSAYGPGSTGTAPVRIRQAIRDESVAETSREESAVADKVKAEAKGKEAAKQQKDKARTVQGVEIPAIPTPPGPEECCMGGCAFCVYDLYADALKEYKTSLSTARDQLLARGVPFTLWPADVPPPSHAPSIAAGGEDEEAAAQDEVDTMIKGLDPVMKSFLETERRIKRRKRERERQEAKRKASPPPAQDRGAGVGGRGAML